MAEALVRLGLRVWYDEFTLRLGDSLSRSIDKGLARSDYGVVILSTAFFAKRWPEYELRGLTAKEVAGGKVILPVWHNVTRDEVLEFSPPLADKFSLVATGRTPIEIAVAITKVVRPSLFEKIHRRLAHLTAAEKAESKKLDPETLRPGPIRHSELPDDLIGRIRLVRASLLEIYTHSMKFWVDGFRRDSHPSKEVSAWEHLCAVLCEYLAMGRVGNAEQARHVFSIALGLSNGLTRDDFREELKDLPSDAFEVIEKLYGHQVPVYDVDDSAELSEEEALAVESKGMEAEDRETFPDDVPEHLLRQLHDALRKTT